ncbi:uncharacterized protein TNCV_4675111 [Trichonephila clavipes]|nr:uncharacterized protein TNCV_4675111 [Trichonephila clavipes]
MVILPFPPKEMSATDLAASTARRKVLFAAVSIACYEAGFTSAERSCLETLTEMLQSLLDVFLGGRFFLRGFEVCFASWDVAGMVLDVVVVVSRTGHAGKGVIIDTVDEEDAAEIDKLLDMAGAVSVKAGIPKRVYDDLQEVYEV